MLHPISSRRGIPEDCEPDTGLISRWVFHCEKAMIRTPLPLNKAIISKDPNGTYADELNDKHYKEIVMDDHLSLLKQQNGSLLVITSIIAVQFSATMVCSGASNPPFLERQGRSCERGGTRNFVRANNLKQKWLSPLPEGVEM